ncbi:MAG TPA: hypothetical protein VGH38_25800 [Bryobacteraceae bacterium]|jgi:hypothetical protein
MTLLRADQAKVEWSGEKNQYHVVITVGAEVIKRWLPKCPHETGDEELRSTAVQTARDEGYEVDPSRITISR